jgi:hypothetical protein
MTIAAAKPPGLITTFLILPQTILTAIACHLYIYIYHHEWSPPLLTFCHHTHAPACHCLPLVSPEHSDDGKEESGALNGSEHISQEPHYIHDDVSIMPNTEEEEQNEKENVEARSEIILLSPTEGGLQVLKHRDITLWFH